MSNPLGILEAMVSAALAKEQYPTPDHVRAVIELLRVTPLCDGVSDSEAEQLARLMEERLGVQMNVGVVLTDSDFRPWLHTAQAEIDPYYWSRYRRLLVDEGKPSSVVTALDRATDRVLGLLGDPRNVGQWNRRGMVVGHVQSGKTANYIGLICKAADAGYKLIVVIAGIHNNLRNQTQTRIDEGFIGRDSARLLSRKGDRFVGVGRFDQLRRPVTFTNSL
ncbi:MAG: endonuclease, partial [Dehalococcoidia bacterium]